MNKTPARTIVKQLIFAYNNDGGNILLPVAAARITHQANRIIELEKLWTYLVKAFPLIAKIVRDEVKLELNKNQGTGDQPSEEVNGDWV